MRKNTYSAQHSSTKLTKVMLIIIWILILAIVCSIGYVFYIKASEIDGAGKSGKTADTGYNKTALYILHDDTFSQIEPMFFLLNFNSDEGKISVSALPGSLSATVNKKTATLKEQFEYGGILQAKQAVDALCSINTDYYCAMECESLENVSDTLGSFEYTVDEAMYAKSNDGVILCDIKKGKQSLGAQQFTEYFRYIGWNESERCTKLGKFAAAMIDAYSKEEISQKITSLFGEVANSLTTDVSVIQMNTLQSTYENFMKLKNTGVYVEVKSSDGKINADDLKKIKNIYK